MKILKIVLFFCGIGLLAAGFYIQDFMLSSWGVDEFFTVGRCGAPHPWEGFPFLVTDFQFYLRLGMALKLAGAAVLFCLVFIKAQKLQSATGRSPLWSSILVVGAAASFAAHTILAVTPRVVEWVFNILGSRFPSDSQVWPALQDAMFARGSDTVFGVLLLALSFILLARALAQSCAGNAAAPAVLVIVPAFLLCQEEVERRAVIDSLYGPWDIFVGSLLFSIIALVLAGLIAAAAVKAFRQRRQRPDKARRLVAIAIGLVGVLAVAYWACLKAGIGSMRSAFDGGEVLSLADIADGAGKALTISYVSSLFLLVANIALPLLVAFFFRVREAAQTRDSAKRSVLGCICIVGLFCFAAFVGVRENPYRAPLRKAALGIYWGGMEYAGVREEVKLLDTDEGFKFLKQVAGSEDEFTWGRAAMVYLWRYSPRSEAKEFVLDVFSEQERSLSAAWAGDEVINSLMHERDGRVRQLALSYLRDKPRHAAKFLKIAFERTYIPTSYVFKILDICRRHGIDAFPFAAQIPYRYADYDLSIPDGFRISYEDGPAAESGAGNYRLNMRWLGPRDIDSAVEAHLGEVVLDVNGERLPVVGDGLGCKIPEYEALAKLLAAFRKRVGEMPNHHEMQVFLEIDPLIPSYHIGQVINTCAGAGITTLHISKP